MRQPEQPPGGTRPALNAQLSPQEFEAWYWLKAELLAFCRDHGLPQASSKQALQVRVRAFLAGESLPPTLPVTGRQRPPAQLTLGTPIGPGWRLGRELRQFFEQHTGPGFRFTQVLRDLFKSPQGATLREALDRYQASRAQTGRTMGGQFQFNQHMRDYFAAHPEGSRQEALRQWALKKQTRGGLPHCG